MTAKTRKTRMVTDEQLTRLGIPVDAQPGYWFMTYAEAKAEWKKVQASHKKTMQEVKDFATK